MSDREEFIARCAHALTLEHPYRHRLSTGNGRAAAVLALIGFSRSEQAHTLVTVRGENVEHHKGQVSFPGGMVDPEDERESNPIVSAALRELEEETGISRAEVDVFGRLPSLHTLSTDFLVHPVVGELSPAIEDIEIRPHELEVERAVWIPFSALLAPEAFRFEEMRSGSFRFQTPAFYYDGLRVWGATAAMLLNWAERLHRVQ